MIIIECLHYSSNYIFPTLITILGRHIATALDEYGDVWGLSDREILFALEKYKAELDMDVPHTDDE